MGGQLIEPHFFEREVEALKVDNPGQALDQVLRPDRHQPQPARLPLVGYRDRLLRRPDHEIAALEHLRVVLDQDLLGLVDRVRQ